jgi:hypothetical protein
MLKPLQKTKTLYGLTTACMKNTRMLYSLEGQASGCPIIHTCGAHIGNGIKAFCMEENRRQEKESAHWANAPSVHKEHERCGNRRSAPWCIFMFDKEPQVVAPPFFYMLDTTVCNMWIVHSDVSF